MAGRRKKKPEPERRPPTLEAIRALVAFADAGESVSGAARALGAQQPVLTTKLKIFQIEAAGVPLLTRDAKGRKLTLRATGRDALPAMRDLVRRYDQLLEHMRGLTDSPMQVKLAVGAFSAQHFVPAAIARLRKQNDGESPFIVKTHVVRGHERIVGVVTGIFDLAIVSHSQEQITETLRESGYAQPLKITPLKPLPLILAAGKRTIEGRALAKMAAGKPVAVAELSQFELAGPDARSGIRQRLEKSAAASVPLAFSAEGGGWSAAREFSRLGLGVAILPTTCINPANRKDFVTRPLDRKFQLQHSIIHRQKKPPAEYRLLIQMLKSAVAACIRRH